MLYLLRANWKEKLHSIYILLIISRWHWINKWTSSEVWYQHGPTTTSRNHCSWYTSVRKIIWTSPRPIPLLLLLLNKLLSSLMEFRQNKGRRNFPMTFRRHSDKKCNRCSRRKFVGIFRRISDDIPINSTVVGIPSEFSDEFPTNHVTVADKYIWPLYSR